MGDATAAEPVKRAALWNGVSLLCPFLGTFLLAVFGPHHDMAWGLAGAAPLIFGGGGGAVVGLIAGIVALARNERRWGLTLAAFLVNLPLALGFAALFFL